jgi:DNA-binding protein H-NS
MAKSLKQVLSQIEKLQKEAQALRAKEISGVVARIREAIEHYGLTPEELFGGAAAKPRGTRRAAARTAKASAPARKAARGGGTPKYHDGAGRTWTGVGKRPNWFKDALAAGKTAEDLLIK